MPTTLSRTAAIAVFAATSLALAACGSSDSGGSPAAVGASGSSSATASGGTAAAVAAVAKYREGVSPDANIPALQGVQQLRGKTVMYMPIALTVPFFQAAIHGLTDSLGAVGVTLQTCDAKANPSAAAACLDQAVKQHVGAVVTDSVPQAFAAQAFAALEAANIPVVTVDNGEGTSSATQAFVGGPASSLQSALTADWVIADSKGKADVLLLEIVDSPASKSYVEDGALPEFKKQCPDCTVTVEKSTTSDLQNVPSLISTALVRDPNINYVYAEFDIDVPAVVQGLQTGSAGSKVKVVSTTGVLTSLQLIASGQHQVADVAQNGDEEGWAAADQAFRLMLGQPARTGVNGSIRIFDATNITSLQLTAENAASGAFFGKNSYRDDYLTAWGAK
jgi:ribose transport system substrate-binding protein